MKKFIAHLPKTRNELYEKHWGVVQRERTRWRKILGIMLGHKEPRETELRRVELTMYRWNLQDPDNLNGSVKHVLDALKHYGWIVDDSLRWIELEVDEHMERVKPKQGIEIKITANTSE